MQRKGLPLIDFQASDLRDIVIHARDADIHQDHLAIKSRCHRASRVRMANHNTVDVEMFEQRIYQRLELPLIAFGEPGIP